jgi:hypothetical protein
MKEYVGFLLRASIRTRSAVRARTSLSRSPFFIVRPGIDPRSPIVSCTSSDIRTLLVAAHRRSPLVAETHTESRSLFHSGAAGLFFDPRKIGPEPTPTSKLKKFPVHGTFIRRIGSPGMSERATTRLVGLSLSGILFAMLILNAFAG